MLTGVVFNAFASAAIVFLASIAGLTEGASIFLWLIGSLSATRVEMSVWVAVFLVLGLCCATPMARRLTLSSLDDESAEVWPRGQMEDFVQDGYARLCHGRSVLCAGPGHQL